MTSDQLERFRHNLLQQLKNCGDRFMRQVDLEMGLHAAGFDGEDRREIGAELLYLEGKGLIYRAAKLISPEVVRWKISADGRDYLAEQKL